MDNDQHGKGLVGILSANDSEILSKQILSDEKEVYGHRIKWTVLPYTDGTNIGIFYLEWETPGKKGMSPLKHQNLAAVRLRGYKEDVVKQTIDDLMKPSEILIPHLRTSKYIIADGTEAAKLYKNLTEKPPVTGKDLADAFSQYTSGTRYSTNP